MSDAKKIVLVSKSGYDKSHDVLLEALLARRIELFCVVGEQCALWEEVMDELVVGPYGDGKLDLVTTSHPDESVAEVVEFAESFTLEAPSTVEIIEV